MTPVAALAVAATATVLIAMPWAYATCGEETCRAVMIHSSASDYRGTQFSIEIPDLYIDDNDCEGNVAVAATWQHMELGRFGERQWMESGVTVGWILNNEFGRNDPECITRESAYYAVSVENRAGERIYVENNEWPHGHDIGTSKVFKVEKTATRYESSHGTSRQMFAGGIYDFRERDTGTHVEYGVEGSVSAVSGYSSIPGVRFEDAQYKAGSRWTPVGGSYRTQADVAEGYRVVPCGTPGYLYAGAVAELRCSGRNAANSPPVHTSAAYYETNGTPLVIPLEATDADGDYVRYKVTAAPPARLGALDHPGIGMRLNATGDASARLLFTPAAPGVAEFNYTAGDGRAGHDVANTVTVNITSIDALTTGDAFRDDFETGLGFWVAEDDDDGDTHDYDFWATGTGGEPDPVDGKYAYMRDCDTGCTLTTRSPAGLSDAASPWLRAHIWVDNIRQRDGDYYRLEVAGPDGVWDALDTYTRDTIRSGRWHDYSRDLSAHGGEDLSFRLSVRGEGSSDYHAIDNVRMYDNVQTRPHAVAGLSASAEPSRVTLSWRTPHDGNSDITGYRIQRASGANSDFATIRASHGGASTVSYVDTGVEPGSTYHYRVAARNAQGTGPYSNTATAAVPLPPYPPVTQRISDITMGENDTTLVVATATDRNGDAAGVTFAGHPAFARVIYTTQSTAALYIDPSEGDAGAYDITATARDSGGRTDTEAFRLTVTDEHPPRITSPPDVTVELERYRTEVDIGSATATDATDPDPAIRSDAPTSFLLGTTVVTWTATDRAGNSATATQNVTVQDTTPPTIRMPDFVALDVPGAARLSDAWINSGFYDASGTKTTQCVVTNPNAVTNPLFYSLGNNTMICSAWDRSGNNATTMTTVMVRPTSPAFSPRVLDDFESGIGMWTQGGGSNWTTRQPAITIPVPESGDNNTVAYASGCSDSCVITLGPVDLSAFQYAYLSLDMLTSGQLSYRDVVRVDLYDGSSWRDAYNWRHASSPDAWHQKTYDLSQGYLVQDFKIRLTVRSSSPGHSAMVDNVVIYDHDPLGFSVYTAGSIVRVYDNLGRFGTYMIRSGTDNLRGAWDLEFGPRGDLYISDHVSGHIRKFNGTDGLPISGPSGWADPAGLPFGLEWRDDTLYVATKNGVEMFSFNGSRLGYFVRVSALSVDDAALRSPQDVAFCGGRAFVTDRALGRILYYDASNGTHLGTLSGVSSAPVNAELAAGLACGPSMNGTGTSLYQSGGFDGYVNEIDPFTGSLIRTLTDRLDHPYGMVMKDSSLYVLNNGLDYGITKITHGGTASDFVDRVRSRGFVGITASQTYSGGAEPPHDARGSRSHDAPNRGPHIEVSHGGVLTSGPISVGPPSDSLEVRATDPERDPVTITAGPGPLLPPGAVSVDDGGRGTATVSLDLTGVDPGTYVVWVTATDSLGNFDVEPYAIVVP